MKSCRCSVVIPVFKSADFLAQTVARTVEFFEGQALSYELILVNDGSPDRSWDVIRELSEANPNIIGVDLLKNYGQHSAIFCGFSHASGDYIVTMDDDLQNPPGEIIHLLAEIEKGHDLVFGRFREKKHGFVRRLGTVLINWINEKVFDKPRDIVLSNFRIARKSVIDRVLEFKTPFPYIPGLLLLCSSRISNVLVEHQSRIEGKSNYNIKRILALMGRLLFNYSAFPLKFICGIGFVASLISFLIGVFFLLKWFLTGVSVKGWTTLVVLTSFFFALVIMTLGVVGEYLVRLINQQSSSRCVFEREIINNE